MNSDHVGWLSFLLLSAAMLGAGCDKPSQSASREPVVVAAGANEVDGSDETEIELTRKLEAKRNSPNAQAASKPPAAAVKTRAPGAGEQRCFQCDGRGQVVCVAAGCRQGYLPCPGRCLKRNQGTWVPDKDHGGMAAAIKVPGSGTWLIPEGHAGEVWVNQGGKLVSLGPCPTCRGQRVIRCQVCDGSARTPCELCETQGAIPDTWKPADNPWFNRQPDLVRLKDERVFLAKEVGGDEVVVMFKTRAGEIISIARTEVTQWPKEQ